MNEKYSIRILSPREKEIVYPYVEKVYEYYTTEGADVMDYLVPGIYPDGKDGSLKDITILWEITDATAPIETYLVEYAQNADFSGALTVTVPAAQQQVALINLYKASDYYVRVSAYQDKKLLGQSETVTFRTTDIGPRVMDIESIYNVRDLGGYMTESGRRTRQGILYRGCGIDGGTQGVIRSEKGDEMLSSLGIVYQMDLRAEHESNLEVKRPISSAKFARHHFCGYEQFFKEENFEKTRSVFRALANKNNYPMYFHCAAGADRTGTLTFLINGLCGVSEKELIQDYEFTSFSVFGHRSLIHGTNYETDESMKGFLDILYTYKGDTLSSKIENLLLSVGVMEEEIYNIKAIMFGDVIV